MSHLGNGTGLTASPIELKVNLLDKVLKNFWINFNNLSMNGGSVKPSSAKNIFNQPDVDGGLIGGMLIPMIFE